MPKKKLDLDQKFKIAKECIDLLKNKKLSDDEIRELLSLAFKLMG